MWHCDSYQDVYTHSYIHLFVYTNPNTDHDDDVHLFVYTNHNTDLDAYLYAFVDVHLDFDANLYGDSHSHIDRHTHRNCLTDL